MEIVNFGLIDGDFWLLTTCKYPYSCYCLGNLSNLYKRNVTSITFLQQIKSNKLLFVLI